MGVQYSTCCFGWFWNHSYKTVRGQIFGQMEAGVMGSPPN